MGIFTGLRPGDVVVFILSVLLTLGTFLWAAGPAGGEVRVEIESPEGRFLYPLETRDLAIHGSLGDSKIHIDPQGVSFQDSPCTNRLCIHQGVQNDPGEWAACLPNRIFVRIVGGEIREGGVDAGSY